MIPYNRYIIDDRIDSLLAEAAHSRLIGKRGPSLRQRMVAGAARLRRSVGTGTSTGQPGVPTLRDYPYPTLRDYRNPG
jgi:hypothetical protein